MCNPCTRTSTTQPRTPPQLPSDPSTITHWVYLCVSVICELQSYGDTAETITESRPEPQSKQQTNQPRIHNRTNPKTTEKTTGKPRPEPQPNEPPNHTSKPIPQPQQNYSQTQPKPPCCRSPSEWVKLRLQCVNRIQRQVNRNKQTTQQIYSRNTAEPTSKLHPKPRQSEPQNRSRKQSQPNRPRNRRRIHRRTKSRTASRTNPKTTAKTTTERSSSHCKTALRLIRTTEITYGTTAKMATTTNAKYTNIKK